MEWKGAGENCGQFICPFIHSQLPCKSSYILLHDPDDCRLIVRTEENSDVSLLDWSFNSIKFAVCRFFAETCVRYPEPGLKIPGFSLFGRGWATVVPHIWATEEMARECFRRPVTLDGLVPTADHNDSCHFTIHACMTAGVWTDAGDVGTFTVLYFTYYSHLTI